MKVLFIYELFFPPFDEGVKNLAQMIHKNLDSEHQVRLVRNLGWLPSALNSLFIVPRIILAGLLFRSDKIIFIPQASLTFSSYIKIFALHKAFGSRLIVLGTQKRVLSEKQQSIVTKLGIQKLFVLSRSMAEPLQALQIPTQILNVGIDRERYQPATDKTRLRDKYNIPQGKRIILHVGHIRESRNIHWLLEVQRDLPDVQVVLVGSTSTDRDGDLCQHLEAAGIQTLKEYLADIQEVYQLADFYCFPVTLEDAAMETPLSILEAMATNLPIITTAFGRLPEQFSDDHCYRYIDNAADIVALLRTDFGKCCSNREKTEPYTWKATAERLVAQQ